MSDPIKDLENFDHQGLPMNPLTPAEVRRRGDRMRRRNNGVLALGAAAAVAVIATSGALVGGALDQDSAPGPAGTSESPSVVPTEVEATEPLTEIPEDFPLDDKMPDAEVTDAAGMAQLDYCGRTPLAELEPVDVRTVGLSGGETAVLRTLYLLDSPEAALQAHHDIADAAWDCSFSTVDTRDSGDVTIQPTVESWPGNTIVEDFGPGGLTEPTVEIVHVVNKGAALLVTSTFGTWHDDIERGVRDTRADIRPIVDAMDLFGDAAAPEHPSADSDETGSDTGTSTSTGDIADSFPLAAGWPDRFEPGKQNGLRGPNRTLPPLAFQACGEELADPEHTDRLRADWQNPEDGRSRQLTTYADAQSAVAAVEAIVSTHRACPEDEVDSAGYVTETEAWEVEVAGADEAWAILERDTMDGAESPFGATTVVVRVGRAVLVMQRGGHGGYPSGDGQGRIDEMTNQAAPALKALTSAF